MPIVCAFLRLSVLEVISINANLDRAPIPWDKSNPPWDSPPWCKGEEALCTPGLGKALSHGHMFA